MIQDMGYQYDNGGIGDGTLTKSSQFTSATTSLDTLYQYDWRHRLVQKTTPDNVVTVWTLDNLGEAYITQVLSGSSLRGQKYTSFDEKMQIYQTVLFNVDPSSGGAGDSLTTNFWSDARGLRIKTTGPNGEFQKTQYDGAGRTTARFVSFDDAETSYADAGTVVNDTVVEESVTTYDAASNVIETTSYRRTTSTSKTGDLSASWSANDSRRMFTAQWFDAANRLITFGNYGTNGGTTLSRPSTPPAPNTSGVLVTKYGYDGGGRPYQITDNLNRLTQKTFDGLSRVTQVVNNYTGTGIPGETSLDTNKTTNTIFDSSGRLSQQVALNPKGSGNGVQQQTTTYVYGTIANQASPVVFRNDILVAEIYPDSDDTYNPGGSAGNQLGNGSDGVYDRVEYTYDYASRKSTVKDQRGVVRTITYDSSGRFSADTVTTLPSGVDGSVLRRGMSYDSISRKQFVTSYTDVGGTNVFSQAKYTYDGWGNVIERDDSHVGAVVSGTTPSVQMAYADGVTTPPGPAKYVRPVSTTYPNGRIVYFNYPAAGSTSVGDHLSRIDNIANDSAGSSQFAQYTYMGAGTILDINHPLVTNGLVYRQGPDTNPGAWDQYDRQIFTKWRNSGQTTTFDMYNYTYDAASNRLTRQNAASVLPSTRNDEFYTYDGLNRLTKMDRGTLSAGQITDSASKYAQQWNALESLGNWRSFQVAPSGGGNWTFQQTRSHNSANEIDVDNNDANAPGTSISNNWTPPTYDKAGNTTTSPVPGNETAGYFYTYDAWNRQVKVQNGTRSSPGSEVVEFQYDAENWRTVKLVPNGSNWNRTDYYFNMRWQCVEERTLTNVLGKTTVATRPSFQWVWDLKYVDAVLLRDVVPIDTTKRLYYCQDANQNSTALVKESGPVVERYVYDPYGKVSVLDGNWNGQSPTVYGNEMLFGGYRKDPETQLWLARNRAYHPTLGRWVQRDPSGYNQGLNLYQYVSGSPSNSTDATGLAECKYLPKEKGAVYLSIAGAFDPTFRQAGGIFPSLNFKDSLTVCKSDTPQYGEDPEECCWVQRVSMTAEKELTIGDFDISVNFRGTYADIDDGEKYSLKSVSASQVIVAKEEVYLETMPIRYYDCKKGVKVQLIPVVFFSHRGGGGVFGSVPGSTIPFTTDNVTWTKNETKFP
jgi:RHS repeat-associated protein